MQTTFHFITNDPDALAGLYWYITLTMNRVHPPVISSVNLGQG